MLMEKEAPPPLPQNLGGLVSFSFEEMAQNARLGVLLDKKHRLPGKQLRVWIENETLDHIGRILNRNPRDWGGGADRIGEPEHFVRFSLYSVLQSLARADVPSQRGLPTALLWLDRVARESEDALIRREFCDNHGAHESEINDALQREDWAGVASHLRWLQRVIRSITWESTLATVTGYIESPIYAEATEALWKQVPHDAGDIEHCDDEVCYLARWWVDWFEGHGLPQKNRSGKIERGGSP